MSVANTVIISHYVILGGKFIHSVVNKCGPILYARIVVNASCLEYNY